MDVLNDISIPSDWRQINETPSERTYEYTDVVYELECTVTKTGENEYLIHLWYQGSDPTGGIRISEDNVTDELLKILHKFP